MDWNWLFSSVAQSNAAIVGIFGAFIITKVLSNQSAFDARKVHIRASLNEAHRIQEEAEARYIRWYNNRTWKGEIASLEEALEKNNSLTAEEFYADKSFSPFVSREETIKDIAKHIDAWHGRRTTRVPDHRMDHLMFNTRALTSLDNRYPNQHLYAQIEAELEAINRVLLQARHHARTMGTTLQLVQSHPESSRQITAVLWLVSGLFLVGVLYPLGLLPAPAGNFPEMSVGAVPSAIFSFRGLLLGMGALFFGSIVVMFHRINASLRYPAEMLEDVEQWSEIGSYSEYFAVYEANDRFEREQLANRDQDEGPEPDEEP